MPGTCRRDGGVDHLAGILRAHRLKLAGHVGLGTDANDIDPSAHSIALTQRKDTAAIGPRGIPCRSSALPDLVEPRCDEVARIGHQGIRTEHSYGNVTALDHGW